MRLSLVLLCALGAFACDDASNTDPPPPDGRLPGHDFEPQPVPEPAPQPAPQPDAEPEPMIPLPDATDGVFRGEGTVMVQISGDEPFDGGGLAVVELLDAAGAIVETREFALDLYPVAIEWSRRFWWISATAADRARVRLLSAEVELRQLESAIVEVPVVTAGCDPTGFTSRCGAGHACLAPALDAEGVCTPVDLLARIRREQDPALTVDLRAAADPDAVLDTVTVVWDDGTDRRFPESAPVDVGWRRVIRIPYAGFDAVDLYLGPHRLVRGLAVEERPVRRLDAPCDPVRLVDTCAAGSACFEEGTCRAIHAPIIDSLRATRTDDTYGVWFAGRDPDRDIDTLLMDWVGAPVGAPRPPEGWLYASAHQQVLHSMIEYAEDGRFEGFWVFQAPEPVAAAGLGIVLVDRETQRSARAEARFEDAAPVPRRVGQSCDVFGAISTCGAAVCDLLDGADRYRCVEPTPGCGSPDAWPPLDGDRISSVATTGVDLTRGSCMRSRGNLGDDRGFSLTAARAGRHRITAQGTDYPGISAITARRRCDLPGPASELACAGDMGGGNGTSEPLTIEVELEAGETIYLLVEGTWIGGGPFTLEVERP